MLYKFLLYLLNLNALPTAILGQGVDIGMTIPVASAALDVSSSAQGVRLPHLSQGQPHALGAGSLVEMDDSNSGSSNTAFVQAHVPNAGGEALVPLSRPVPTMPCIHARPPSSRECRRLRSRPALTAPAIRAG